MLSVTRNPFKYFSTQIHTISCLFSVLWFTANPSQADWVWIPKNDITNTVIVVILKTGNG